MFITRAEDGFTFIEVLVALLIFVLVVLAAVGMAQGAVRATLDTKEMSTATWLIQKVMVELETRLETEGMEKGCDKKKEGKFEAPYERFTWFTYCTELDFNISEAAAKIAKAAGVDEEQDNKEDLFQKMILKTAGEYISKSMRELHTEVAWQQDKHKRVIALTTHFVRYDQPLQLPGIPGAPGGSSGTGEGEGK